MPEKPVKIAFFSPELRFRLGGSLPVLLADFTLPDHLRNDFFIFRQQFRVQQAEQLFTELGLEFLPEGRSCQRLFP